MLVDIYNNNITNYNLIFFRYRPEVDQRKEKRREIRRNKAVWNLGNEVCVEGDPLHTHQTSAEFEAAFKRPSHTTDRHSPYHLTPKTNQEGKGAKGEKQKRKIQKDQKEPPDWTRQRGKQRHFDLT